MISHYATLLRPPGPGAVPRDGLLSCNSIEGITPSGHHAWGTVDYNRRLTPKEIAHYDLEHLYTTTCFDSEEENTMEKKMTVKELARMMVENDSDFPNVKPITIDQAQNYVEFSINREGLSEPLYPDALMKAYNYYASHIDEEFLPSAARATSRSEVISMYRSTIKDAMLTRYKNVLASGGQMQYKIYIWDDGEVEALSGPQGDNSFLQARDGEPRSLYYVCQVGGSYFDPWDLTDETKPEDDALREAMEQELIASEMDAYEDTIDDMLDGIIKEAKQEEEEDERYERYNR